MQDAVSGIGGENTFFCQSIIESQSGELKTRIEAGFVDIIKIQVQCTSQSIYAASVAFSKTCQEQLQARSLKRDDTRGRKRERPAMIPREILLYKV